MSEFLKITAAVIVGALISSLIGSSFVIWLFFYTLGGGSH